MHSEKIVLSELVAAIGRGEFDEHFDTLHASLRHRRKALQAQNDVIVKADLKVGDTVTISGLSPKYLNACQGTVATMNPNGSRVEVRLEDTPLARKYAGAVVGIPAGCLVKVGGDK